MRSGAENPAGARFQIQTFLRDLSLGVMEHTQEMNAPTSSSHLLDTTQVYIPLIVHINIQWLVCIESSFFM